MARYINQRRKTLLKVKRGASAYRQLVAMAQSAHDKLTGNADFATVSPTLVNLQAAIDDLKAAMAPLGIKRNRASKSDLQDCQAKAILLKSYLTALNVNLQNTAFDNEPNDTIAAGVQLSTTGMGLKNKSKRTKKPFGIVRNLHQLAGSSVISWQRPKGLIKGKRPDSYVIKQEGQLVIGSTTATTFDTHVVAGEFKRITVQAVGPNGAGRMAKITVRGV